MSNSNVLMKNDYVPSFLVRILILIQLFLRKYLYDKKSYLLIVITFLPLLTTSRIKSGAEIADYVQLAGPSSVFAFLIMPLISLILGISAIADEKENKTISQLISRPVRREELIISKWITIMIIGITIIIIDSLILFFGLALFIPDSTIILTEVDVLFGTWGFLVLWYVVYSSIFLLLGIIIDKNAIGWGLTIAYFETFFGQLIFAGPVGNSAFSISNHVKNITAEYFLSKYLDFQIENFDPYSSIIVCFGIIVFSLISGCLLIRNKDFP